MPFHSMVLYFLAGKHLALNNHTVALAEDLGWTNALANVTHSSSTQATLNLAIANIETCTIISHLR